MGTKRYRLKIATWTVVREVGQPSPRRLDSPEAVVELARDLLRDHDDDKEHFWVVLLNAKNHYLMAHLVSTGTQSATLVQPREVLGPALREGAAALVLIHNHQPQAEPHQVKDPGDPWKNAMDGRDARGRAYARRVSVAPHSAGTRPKAI